MKEPNRHIAPAVSDFGHLSIPAMRKLRLDNGIVVNVMDQSSSIDVSRLSCVFAGGLAECASQTVARLTPALMLEGTMAHPDGGMAELIEFNGARQAFSVEPHFTSMVLYTLNSKVKDVFPLFPQILFDPQMSEHAYDVVRDRHIQNVEMMMKKVEYNASMAFNRLTMGGGHPLARMETPDSIRGVALDDLNEWCGNLFRLSSKCMTLYLAGRITPEVEDAVNDTFGSLPVDGGEGVGRLIRPFEASAEHTVRTHVEGAVQSAVRIGLPVIGRNHPDYIALRYLVMALGGYFGSRLMSNIREDKGYTYGINSFLLGQPEGGLMEVVASTDPVHEKPLIDEVVAEIKRLYKGDFTDDELDRLRKHAMSGLASTLDNAFEMMDYYQTLQTAFIPEGYFDRQINVLANLTAEELGRVAREHLPLDRLYISVAGA